jgi:hypothetical protein
MAQPVHPDEATGFTLHIYMLAGISKTIKTRVCLCINKSSKVIQSGGILGDALEVVTWYVAIVEYRGDIPTYEGHCHTSKKKRPTAPPSTIHGHPCKLPSLHVPHIISSFSSWQSVAGVLGCRCDFCRILYIWKSTESRCGQPEYPGAVVLLRIFEVHFFEELDHLISGCLHIQMEVKEFNLKVSSHLMCMFYQDEATFCIFCQMMIL